MGESANFCENRLLSYLTTDNAAFTTTLSFPPQSAFVLVKTGHPYSVASQGKVKTANG
jgi:hypothetical protein